MRWLQHRAREANVPVVQVEAAEIDAVTQGNSHGGIAAEAGQTTVCQLGNVAAVAGMDRRLS